MNAETLRMRLTDERILGMLIVEQLLENLAHDVGVDRDVYASTLSWNDYLASDEAAAVAYCDEHGWRLVVDTNAYAGFCAGFVYVDHLACGCQRVDDCSYLED